MWRSGKMAAPKGNKFAIGNNGGRPSKFETAEEMTYKIDEYFKSYKPGQIPVLGYKPTVCGLALYLGFESRQSIYDYRDKSEEFSYIIKRALTFIEMNYEQNLESKNPAGAIFALKNMGWTDSKDITTKGERIDNRNNFFFTSDDFTEEE